MNSTPVMLGQRLRALAARRVGLAAWLWGEAGIGKTHVSQALLRETPCRSLTLAAALEALQEGRAVTAPPADILAPPCWVSSRRSCCTWKTSTRPTPRALT